MASAYTPTWKRALQRWIPWLFSECPGGNKHWRWDLTCFCVLNENGLGMFYRRNNDDIWRECPNCHNRREGMIRSRDPVSPVDRARQKEKKPWTDMDREVI